MATHTNILTPLFINAIVLYAPTLLNIYTNHQLKTSRPRRFVYADYYTYTTLTAIALNALDEYFDKNASRPRRSIFAIVYPAKF